MKTIDSHQHFWRFNPIVHKWIPDDMAVLRQDFLPEDLLPLLHSNNIDGSVAIQADQSEAENTFLLDLADEHSFIRGVVGWVDFRAENIQQRLEHYHQYDKMKGFRHILQNETDRAFMLGKEFMRGISYLEQFGYTYDILIYPDQLSHAIEFVKAFPNQQFVIDHLAKPYISTGEIDYWKQDIRDLAQYQNVHCKLSGIVTEADWHTWQSKDFRPYLDVIFDYFGAKRLMFGSDWPVCNVAGTYGDTINIIRDYMSWLSANEQQLIMGTNAVSFYNLT